jgi:DNA-binding transcriptional LysR family regulator
MAYVDMLKTFVRVYELGSMSAAARDLRVSAAVSSSRISDLEKSLGVRLFNRTTRSLRATAHGELFYKGAIKILDTIREVEGGIAEITAQPKGTLFISAPLALGKKLVAPLIPAFKAEYPDINVRLRLSDRKVDIAQEGPRRRLRARAVARFGSQGAGDPRVRTPAGCLAWLCRDARHARQRRRDHGQQAQVPAAALSRRDRILLEPAGRWRSARLPSRRVAGKR